MDELFQYLETLHPLSDELKAALVGKTHRETYRKNRPLLRIGDTADWIGYIEKGFAKLCYDTTGGRERIVSFLKTGEMACSMSSFHSQTPSRFAIVALDDTIIRRIPRREAEAVAEKYPTFHRHLRKITEEQSSQLESHYLLISEPAKDRLTNFPERFGWMLKDKRIKDYMIADFLGVHRVTLGKWNTK
jgi:CRP-like cAMP-binding protein